MLTVKDLRTPLIGPIDLTLEAGTVTAISGPSGAGKSLLLRAIADLDPNDGEVTLQGVGRAGIAAPEWRRAIALVPAESGWWAATVGEHLQSGVDPSQLLQAVGLPGAAGWRVDRLSTGERQRLAFVRAIQLDPQVLLLDEPTAALDPPSTRRIETLISERAAAGSAVLLVTHDPAQPERLGARMLTMTKGQLEISGRP